MRGFRFAEFDAQCSELNADQLQQRWQHYTRALSAASTSTAVATLAAAPAGGISMIGAMIAGPLVHNARKKRHIIEKHMGLKGVAPDTQNSENYGPTLGRVTEVVSHAVLDGPLTKERAKEVAGRGDRQLIRTSSMPAMGPAADSAGSEKTAQVSLKHANTVPGSLGAAGSALLASASRIRAEKYPLLKEYISSVATQSKSYMSLGKPGGNGLSPAGRNWTESAAISAVDSDPLPADDSKTSSSRRSVAQIFVAELEGDSYYSHSLVSPLGSTVSEMEDELEYGSVSPCETTCTNLEEDHAFDNLLSSMDETALSEIENELELAIQEMDDTTTRLEDTADEQVSIGFHSPTDLDAIVRRQSTRYSKRCSVRDSKYSFDDTQHTISQASVLPLRPPRSFGGGLNLTLVGDQTGSDFSHEDMVKEAFEAPSPTVSVLPAYSETDPEAASEVCASNSSALSSTIDTTEKEAVVAETPTNLRGSGLSHTDSSASHASSTRLIMSDPTSPELVVALVPTSDSCSEMSSSEPLTPTMSQSPEFVEPAPPASSSKLGSRALSVHNGMKKVGYFGLEPATKIAVGGSLLLMGVRPSVQRKMLDKAKSKMGMPEKQKERNEDDDYVDYI